MLTELPSSLLSGDLLSALHTVIAKPIRSIKLDDVTEMLQTACLEMRIDAPSARIVGATLAQARRIFADAERPADETKLEKSYVQRSIEIVPYPGLFLTWCVIAHLIGGTMWNTGLQTGTPKKPRAPTRSGAKLEAGGSKNAGGSTNPRAPTKPRESAATGSLEKMIRNSGFENADTAYAAALMSTIASQASGNARIFEDCARDSDSEIDRDIASPAYILMDSLIGDRAARDFLGINIYDGVEWFDRERYGDLVFWIYISLVLARNIHGSRGGSRDLIPFALVALWMEARNESNYRVDHLLSYLTRLRRMEH